MWNAVYIERIWKPWQAAASLSVGANDGGLELCNQVCEINSSAEETEKSQRPHCVTNGSFFSDQGQQLAN